MDKCTEERFLNDVSGHVMTVLEEDGVHRRIRFSKPDSGVCRFDLITWPGYLCFCGDMGSYVFTRINDMFQFFRTVPPSSEKDKLLINLSYWEEKCIAADVQGGTRRYSKEKFVESIREYMASHEWPFSARKAVAQDLLPYLDECGGEGAYALATERDFAGYRFEDLFEYEFKEYTFRFIWCCYALAWGVQKYDEMKVAEAV